MRAKTVYAVAGLLVVTIVTLVQAAVPPQKRPPRPPEGTRVVRDLAYVAGGHERRTLDLYLPAEGTKWPSRL